MGLGLVKKQATERMLLTFQLNELQGCRVTVMVWQECNEVSWHALGSDVKRRCEVSCERGETNSRWEGKLNLQ